MGSLFLLVLAIAAVAGALAAVGFGFGVFRWERVEPPAPAEPANKETVGGWDDDDEFDDGLDGYKPYDDEFDDSAYDVSNFEDEDDEDDGFDFDKPGNLDDFDDLEDIRPKSKKAKKKEKERVSLDYFAEEDPDQQEQRPPAFVEQVDITFDKLCSFKTGRSHELDCQEALNEARVGERAYAVAYFDYDRFRFINSLKGVSIGDYILSRTSQEIVEIFPEGSLFTRISADHFSVLFPIVDEGILEDYTEQLRRMAERIRDAIGAKSGLRICMGIASTGGEQDYDIGLLETRANVARHCLKISRSEAHAVFDDSMLESYLYGEQAMEDYSENQYGDDFIQYFLPVFDLKKGRIVGCESLARWTCIDDFHKDEPPSSEDGHLPTNNTKLIYHVCRWMGRWRKAGKEVLLGLLHIPVTDLFKEDIDHYLAKCLSAFQLEPRSLAVEVDINLIRINPMLATSQLKKIRDIGMRVVLSGIDRRYASLEPLSGLPVDFIKFHRNYVMGLIEDKHHQEQVTAIIAQAGQLGYRTIFEGVDTQDQADILRRAGAHMAEGFYVGRSSLPDDFVHDLQEVARDSSRRYNTTVILNDDQLARGEFNVM